MNEKPAPYDAFMKTWGPLLGLLLLFLVINRMLHYYQTVPFVAPVEEKVAQAASASAEGQPQTQPSAAITTTQEVTAVNPISEPVAVAVAPSAPITTTQEVTTVPPISEPAAAAVAPSIPISETQPVESSAPAAITTTQEVTAVNPISESVAVAVAPSAPITDVQPAEPVAPAASPATQAVTTTQAVTASTSVSEPVAVAAAPPAAATEASAEVDAAIVKGGCKACHTIDGVPGAKGIVGPNLSTIGVDGATRIPGYTAEQYIHESLVTPNAFTAPKCPFGACVPGTMPANLTQTLSEDEINLIVGYLAKLGVAQ